MFDKSKFIWREKNFTPDDYAEFSFTVTGDGRPKNMTITAGSDYNVFVGGRLAFFGQYPDYPEHRCYDVLPLGDVLENGENTVTVVVWYYGYPSAGYVIREAYLAFEVTDESGNIVAKSDENILSRTPSGYILHKCKEMTPQIGLGWSYDATLDAGEWHKSAALPAPMCEWNIRPIKKTAMHGLVKGEAIGEGYFTYTKADERPSELMQRADFSPMYDDRCDGKYYMFDLGREYVGFPEIEFDADDELDLMIGWGEHFTDGRCRTATRNYDFLFHAKKGKNHLLASLRRIGCRYLQIFVIKNDIKVGYIGVRPVEYPVDRLPAPAGLTELERRIYDASVYTLECCMHDHYEDCPWREQALYTLDSRNQMLCGYYAFEGGNADFARASLKLISYGQRDDRLLTLTFPTSLDSPIPYYSLAYFYELDEYVRHTGDTSIVREVFPLLEDILDLFASRLTPDGLLAEFDGCWNYYEWEPTLDGGDGADTDEVDAPLAAFYVLALEAMARLCDAVGKDHAEYDRTARKVREAIGKMFYDSETKLFRSYGKKHAGRYSVMTNAVCLLCGAADGYDTTNIVKILASNSDGGLGYNVIPNSLSMNSFRFDALLALDREKYAPVILAEIDRDYKMMLDRGATTFWETLKGEDDMWYGASLCHGWSALPVYYYRLLVR